MLQRKMTTATLDNRKIDNYFFFENFQEFIQVTSAVRYSERFARNYYL